MYSMPYVSEAHRWMEMISWVEEFNFKVRPFKAAVKKTETDYKWVGGKEILFLLSARSFMIITHGCSIVLMN